MAQQDRKVLLTDLLPCFIDSLKEVFETMVFMPVTSGDISSKRKGFPSGFISGIISLTGEEIGGNVSLVFTLPLATAIFCSMMGMDPASTVAQQEVNDVVGELANMVAGGAKSRLQEKNVNFKIGLPTVVVGEGHYLEPAKNAETAVVEAVTDKGSFFMEISF